MPQKEGSNIVIKNIESRADCLSLNSNFATYYESDKLLNFVPQFPRL